VHAIKEAINETPYSVAISMYSFAAALIIAMTALSMFLLFSVFSFIEKEDTPFSDRALKKLLVSLIIIDVVIGLTSSPGFGVIGGLITWAVYTIMDYGRTLQIQSDETL
jgi:FtsH-binding integral membrane protein